MKSCTRWLGVRASHRHRRTLFASAHYIPEIDHSGRMMANAGVAIAHISGTVDRRCRACSFHHPAPFLRLAGCERQPGQIFGQQLAAFRSDQPIAEERKTGPRAGQVDTVVRVELNHAAISSLAGVPGRRQEPSQRPSHCHAEDTNAAVARYSISHNVYYVQSLSEDARVPLASITGLAMPSQEASLPSVPLAAWQLRLPPSSDQSLVHDPGDPAADQAALRDNDSKANKAVGAQSRTFIVLPPPIASAGHVP